jgi:hypothetical protein
MPKKSKDKQLLPYILTPLLEKTIREYKQLYSRLCSSEPQNEYCNNPKGFYNFLSDILQELIPLISSFEVLKDIKTLNYLKSQGFYLIPVHKQDLGDGLIKENTIEKLVNSYLNIVQPKNLADGIGLLNLISAGVTITTQKDGICEELNITFKYKQEEEKVKDLVIKYAQTIANKMGYVIKGMQVDSTLIKLRCCK